MLHAFPYFGGKRKMLDRLLPLLPHTSNYVEPYFGSGAVYFSKRPRSRVNVLNDIDGRISTFYRVLRDQPCALVEAIDLTPTDRNELVAMADWSTATTELEIARRTYSLLMAAHMPDLDRKKPALKTRHGRIEHTLLRTLDPTGRLLTLHRHLRGAVVESRNAVALIDDYRLDPDTLIYCDPPYLHSTRVSTTDYPNEMSVDDHRALLSVVTRPDTAARVVISGYRAPLYDVLLARWWRYDYEVMSHIYMGAKSSKHQRVESVWCNYSTGAGSLL